MLSIFPDSSPTRAWVAELISSGMRNEAENAVYIIMTDDEQNGKVVSRAKWTSARMEGALAGEGSGGHVREGHR
jgi:hypothetical protein